MRDKGEHLREPDGTDHFGAVASITLAITAVAVLVTVLVAPAQGPSQAPDQQTGAQVVGASIETAASGDARPFAEELLDPLTTQPEESSRIEVAGATVDTSALAELEAAIDVIEADGHDVGFLMLDAQTGATVGYHADRSFYSASSIKGPYVASVVSNVLGDAAQGDGRVDAILRYSDNEAYASFRNQYGNDPMRALVDAAGAEQLPSEGINEEVAAAAELQSAPGIADNHYEFLTPAQMVAMWDQCRMFLESGEPGAAWLAGELQAPEISSLSHVGRAWGTTWAKAGWYPDDASSFATTVDAGVVRTQTGDVVIAVMTTSPIDFPATASVILPLLELHAQMS